MKKINLTDKKFYEEHENVYNVISDYIYDNLNSVPILRTTPSTVMDIFLQDCFFDDETGNFYAPYAYEWTYKGSEELDDQSEYTPVYTKEPTLTRLQIANLVAFAEEPELNDPAKNI